MPLVGDRQVLKADASGLVHVSAHATTAQRTRLAAAAVASRCQALCSKGLTGSVHGLGEDHWERIVTLYHYMAKGDRIKGPRHVLVGTPAHSVS